MDQSGSMADSVVYGAVCGSIFASLPALDTHVVAFDTEVVDLTEKCGNDPVDMIFGVQLGGGTDINKSVAYCEKFITEPKKTLFILITDLFEGGNEAQLVRRLGEMRARRGARRFACWPCRTPAPRATTRTWPASWRPWASRASPARRRSCRTWWRGPSAVPT